MVRIVDVQRYKDIASTQSFKHNEDIENNSVALQPSFRAMVVISI